VPILTVIASPNGFGKSTLARFVDFDGHDRPLDPDTIAVRLNPLNPSVAAIAAAKYVLKRTAAYFRQSESFAVETTLSSRGRVDLLRRASPERCIARIRHRAALGGHFVPDADVRRRYARSIANAANALRLADFARAATRTGGGGGQSDVAGRAGSRLGQVVNRSTAEAWRPYC
jgi:predicted ABC-type ATPase